MTKQTNYLDVKGMYCSACAARIEKVVAKIDGVSHVSINLTTETGQVTYNKRQTNIAEIIERVNQIGFEATKLVRDEKQLSKDGEIKVLRWRFLCSAFLTIPLAWAMLAHFKWASFIYVPPLFLHPYFQLFITIPIQFIIGYQFYERAWKAIKHGSTNMDVLVVLSTSAAFFYSHYITFTVPYVPSEPIVLYFETSAFIITFILLGRLLEAQTKLRTTEALEKLYDVQTKMATVLTGHTEVETSVDQLQPGDRVIVKPGDRVPIDGQVLEGYSMIDESLLTGESVPIEKNIDDFIYAGTINQHGVLTVKVTKKDSETALSNIIHIVEQAQASKAPIQHIADKITGVFVPIVMIIAIITFSSWYFLLQPENFNGALSKVIAVLIIACPCALGLATPTSIMVGSGRAAQSGILFKEGKFLELLGKSNYVLLDKTGTITTGIPTVSNIFIDHWNEREFLKIIGAVERMSDHPVAIAIYEEASEKIHSFPTATSIQNLPGFGIKAVVNHHNVTIANSTYFHNKGVRIPSKFKELEERLKAQGKAVMIARIDKEFAGIIAVADQIKTTSYHAIAELKQMGYEIVLLTGDHEQAGLKVARKVGIDHVYTGCTPEDKAAIVEQLQQEGNHVLMVGDGINDAPALAVAHTGVAIGTGSDIAIESGDVTLINGHLNKLIEAIRLSKKTMVNIKQNFVWAFLYNVVMIPFAMVGILVPWLAGAAMAFSSVSVVLNSLRLKRVPL